MRIGILPGQYFDQETGLHYNWHRYYGPTSGRYARTDPIGIKGGPHLYLYVQDNPLNYFDYHGLEKSCAYGNCACEWKGWLNLVTVGKLAGGFVTLTLESDCCEGKEARGIYMGPVAGISLSPFPAQVVAQPVNLVGPEEPSDKQPRGLFQYAALGLGLGGGVGFSGVICGELSDKDTLDTPEWYLTAIDIGLDIFAGAVWGGGKTRCCDQ
ncbi:MAG: RHS repeat-associated core domain-containing protein [Deltaproteobacteria bacterium]|nr:RHS repeat-associated core domain-containing protein [Deltaproteobacteria bacterium]